MDKYINITLLVNEHKFWLKGSPVGRRADFSDGYLERVDLWTKNLKGAIFRNAMMYESFLHSADLRYTDFRGANLKLARFNYADLSGADFSGTDLYGASFRGAYVKNANFKGAIDLDLSDADFTGDDFPIKTKDLGWSMQP